MADFEKLKQTKILEFKKNKYISDFISSNNLKLDDISNNFTSFDECYKSLELCKNCTGLDDCKQRKKGEVIGLINDGFILNNVIYCKKYIEKQKIKDLMGSYIYSDIPQVHSDLTLDNIKVDEDGLKQLFVMCYDLYEENRDKGLYIYGDLGVGKTYMCIALSNSLVLKGKKVAFIKINDFVTKMSQLIRENVSQYELYVKKIKNCDYLIIDDIGSESVSEFSRDRLLFNILDYRMENKLCTIFTSNLDKASLLKHFETDSLKINAKRLLERIDILTDDYVLNAINKRRI